MQEILIFKVEVRLTMLYLAYKVLFNFAVVMYLSALILVLMDKSVLFTISCLFLNKSSVRNIL